MVAPSATALELTPDGVEFIRFCYARRRIGWPELYDEMCAVASRGLFRGWGPDDLAAHGIGFTLFDMPRLAVSVSELIADARARDKEAALRSPRVVRSNRAAAVA
jgi:hypothetical protein